MAPGEVHRKPVVELVKLVENNGGHLRWSDVPDVQDKLTHISKNLQLIKLCETKFELISQEAIFNLRLRSLLGSSFITRSLREPDRKCLFSSLDKVAHASDLFLEDLEQCWRRDVLLTGIFDVVRRHDAYFDACAQHCSNQKGAVQHLLKLKAENPAFVEVLETWQGGPDNYSQMDVESLLDLPKGRIVSVLLSCEVASSLMDKHDAELKSCLAAIKSTKKVADKCDLTVDMFGQRTSMSKIVDQLRFADEVPHIPLARSARVLVMVDEVTLLTLSGGNISRLSPRHLVLFNDLILIAKKVKPKEERYVILDYCYLDMVEMKSLEDLLSVMQSAALNEIQEKLLLIKLKKNFENKAAILLFSCPSEATRDDWHRKLSATISHSNSLPVAEEAPTVLVPALEPAAVQNRSSDQLRIIEELKIKQESRKKDWLVPENVMDEFNDILEDAPAAKKATKPFLIPRPTPRPLSVNFGEPPTVSPRHSHVPEDRKLSSSKPSRASVEDAITFDSLLEYPAGMTIVPLVTSRWMIRSGEMTLRWLREEKKYSDMKLPVHVTLLSDVIFVTTKKKGDMRHKVRSYCMRNLVDMSPVKKLPHLPPKLLTDRVNKFMFMIQLLENQSRKTETMVVCVSSAKERDSWLLAQPAPVVTLPGKDHVYDVWDRPLVVVTQPHQPTTRYEIQVAVHDKLLVNRLRADGWYEGERVSDGKTGLFPVSCAAEMDSPHKHAREVRQRATSLIRD